MELDEVSSTNQYVQLSIDLLEATKKKLDVSHLQQELTSISIDSLEKYLATDSQKKAFWINIYNANIQLILAENSSLFDKRNQFFTKKRITIAKHNLSFDAIEHGIIRSSKYKLALGLIKNPFASAFEKRMRTKQTDGRIHFALNCGAKSCPAIATYDAHTFNEKIDEVSREFLKEVSIFDSSENKFTTTPLFSWFRGDFGGNDGIKNVLIEYELIPSNTNPSIHYSDYDWTLSLANYYEK